MRRFLAVALATGAVLVLQLGLSVGGGSLVGNVSLPWGIAVVQANGDANGDFHSGVDDGFGPHTGEKGNGGTGNCHCGDNGNNK